MKQAVPENRMGFCWKLISRDFLPCTRSFHAFLRRIKFLIPSKKIVKVTQLHACQQLILCHGIGSKALVHVYTRTCTFCMCLYSTLAKLVVKEEKKENPDPIHHTRTIQTRKRYNIHVHCMCTITRFLFLNFCVQQMNVNYR